MSRAAAVLRMHLTDRVTLLLMPWSIVASSFVINLVIWNLVPVDGRRTGGAAALYVFLVVAAMFAVIRGLPFALGMGSTRRSFTAGTWLTALVLGVAFGTATLLLQVAERASGGWWLQGHFFWFSWFSRDAWPATWLLLVVSMVATFGVGAVTAALWTRFRLGALLVGVPTVVLVGGGAVALAIRQSWWGGIGDWFAGLTPLSATLWCAVLALACLGGTWGVLRRVRAT